MLEFQLSNWLGVTVYDESEYLSARSSLSKFQHKMPAFITQHRESLVPTWLVPDNINFARQWSTNGFVEVAVV